MSLYICTVKLRNTKLNKATSLLKLEINFEVLGPSKIKTQCSATRNAVPWSVLIIVSGSVLLPHTECSNWRRQARLHSNVFLLQTTTYGKKTVTFKMDGGT
jgi:hypothetical protein